MSEPDPQAPPTVVGQCAVCGVTIMSTGRPVQRTVRTGFKQVELGTGRKIKPEQERTAKLLCSTCGRDAPRTNVMEM